MAKKKNTMLITAIIILITVLVLFMANNFTPFYGAFSCTFNIFDCPYNITINETECDECAWNKYDCSCTSEIRNECCEDCEEVRECSGQIVTDPLLCYTYYCWQDEHKCVPIENEYTGEGYYNYKCTCEDINY